MWGTNQQWWQMPYGYQYQTPAQGSSEDWAVKAAMWAEQRRVQEQTQRYYNQVGVPQPVSYHGDPARHPVHPYMERKYDVQISKHQSTHKYPNEEEESVEPPPLPPEPEKEPTPPGLVPEQPPPSTDNMETIAMEAEAPEPATPIIGDRMGGQEFEHKPGLKVDNFYVHNAMPSHPDYCPSPPSLAHREMYDHNHGYDTPPRPFSDSQQFDYGHHSASIDYNHQRQGPVVFDYSRQYDGGYHQLPYEGERYFPPAVPSLDQTPRTDEVAVIPGSVDFSALSDVKKKGLPLWIREGLERMEKQKQKKQENQSPMLNTSSSSVTSISGYKHSSPLSPAHSPKKEGSDEESVQQKEDDDDDDEEEEEREEYRSSDEEEEDETTLRRGQHLFSKSHARSPKAQKSSEEEDSKVDDAEREQNLVLNIRRLLTEILLTVTNDEITSIAQGAYDAAATGYAHRLRPPSDTGASRSEGVLGLADYGSDSRSESGTEKESEGEKEDMRRSRRNDEDDREYYDDRRSSRSQKDRDDYASESDEEHTKSHRSSKRRKKDKRRRSRSRSSEESDRSDLTPERKKSRRRKHSRRERSRSSSPKHRSKRRGSRKSRSRSKSPKKHKSSRKSKSRSASPSDIDSRSASKHKRSKRSRSRERKKPRSSSRGSPGSPGDRHRRDEEDTDEKYNGCEEILQRMLLLRGGTRQRFEREVGLVPIQV